ncbi:MAG: HPr family phosphocarrier protein [Saprospiraceae bacterium]
MISKTYIIKGADGIHARPATALVRLVKQYKSSFMMKKGDKSIALNSMLNILSFGAVGGDSVTIDIVGEDETEASKAIELFFTEVLNKL